MDFNQVVQKYNYSDDLANFLRDVYEEMVNYFGEEERETIFYTFLETEVISASNVYDGLVLRNMLDESEGVVTKDDLKRSNGVNQVIPDIIFDAEAQEFKIAGVRRLIVINSLDLNQDPSKGSLIHELGHAVKAYRNTFKIEGNILIYRNGLSETQEELYLENGIVKKRMISDIGVGLEEGLNSVMEEEIARKVVNPEYKTDGYIAINSFARTFIAFHDLKRILMAQMRGTKAEFVSFYDFCFGNGMYREFESVLDNLYGLNLELFASLFDQERYELINKKIEEVIIYEYNPMIDKMNNSLSGGGR